MPIGKRTFRSRRRFGGKKTFRRKRNVSRKTRILRKFTSGNYHRFTRYSGYTYGFLTDQMSIANYSVGGVVPPIGSRNASVFNFCPAFSISDCDGNMLGTGNEEFSRLFDDYRIRGAVVEITGNNNAAFPNDALAGATLKGALKVRWVYDHNDSSTANMNTDIWWAQRAPLVKEVMLTGNRTIKIPVRPTPITLVNDTALSSAASTIKRGQWISMVSPAVPHYGLKIQVVSLGMDSIPVPTSSDVPPFFWRIKYIMEFKGPR